MAELPGDWRAVFGLLDEDQCGAIYASDALAVISRTLQTSPISNSIYMTCCCACHDSMSSFRKAISKSMASTRSKKSDSHAWEINAFGRPSCVLSAKISI